VVVAKEHSRKTAKRRSKDKGPGVVLEGLKVRPDEWINQRIRYGMCLVLYSFIYVSYQKPVSVEKFIQWKTN